MNGVIHKWALCMLVNGTETSMKKVSMWCSIFWGFHGSVNIWSSEMWRIFGRHFTAMSGASESDAAPHPRRPEFSEHIYTWSLGIHVGVSGGAVGWGTAPQDGRFRFWFPVGFLEIFKWHSPSVCIQQPWGRLSLYDYHGIALRAKVQPAYESDQSDILVVTNVTVTVEAQYFLASEFSWLLVGKLYLLLIVSVSCFNDDGVW
jgi:hypothetical protein